MSPGTLRVALCDDHRLVIEGVRGLLAGFPDVECVGTAQDGAQLLYLLEHIQADVILLDLDMPVMDGSETLRRIKAKHQGLKVIMLTMNDGAAVVQQAMDLGADGYLLKTCGKEELLLAMREVHAGRKHFTGMLMASLFNQKEEDRSSSQLLKDLSEREVEVLAALAEGLGNKEIGERLHISPRTVDTHRTNLMRKLDTHHIAGLVRIAIKAGLVG